MSENTTYLDSNINQVYCWTLEHIRSVDSQVSVTLFLSTLSSKYCTRLSEEPVLVGYLVTIWFVARVILLLILNGRIFLSISVYSLFFDGCQFFSAFNIFLFRYHTDCNPECWEDGFSKLYLLWASGAAFYHYA